MRKTAIALAQLKIQKHSAIVEQTDNSDFGNDTRFTHKQNIKA